MNLRVFTASCLVGYREFCSIWSWKAWFLGYTVRVGAFSISWVLLSRLLNSDSMSQYLVIGQIFVVAAGGASWAISGAARDRLDGTFESILVTPANYLGILVGRTFVWCLNGFASSILAASLLLTIFPAYPQLNYTVLCFALATTSLSAYAFSLFAGIVAANRPSTRNIILGLVTIIFATFTGAMVPVAYWPYPISLVSDILPLTNAIEAVRSKSTSSFPDIIRPLAWEMCVSIGWFTAAALVASRVCRVARATGGTA